MQLDSVFSITTNRNEKMKRWHYSLARISDVTATLMKGHNDLHLQAMFLGHFHQFHVPAPIILSRLLSLHQPPPHVHHHPLHSGALQRRHRRVHRLPPIHRVPRRHAVQWHHHENRHATPLSLLPSQVVLLLFRHLRRERLTRRRQIRPARTRRRRQSLHAVRLHCLALHTHRRRLQHQRRRRVAGVEGRVHRRRRSGQAPDLVSHAQRHSPKNSRIKILDNFSIDDWIEILLDFMIYN
ncbi:hypothetical protein V8G54_011572 [Vigna mungo]|uniref:Uncharacterized protein n=1 Tax=Vigna mungo TaxID=3915 RepID=A0AAQ3NPW0_VIGMU